MQNLHHILLKSQIFIKTMDSTEIKHEFESDSRLQCRACLTVGRKLVPLGLLTNIYMKLTAGLDHLSLISAHPIEICWECQSLLRKVVLFQKNVKKAQELLLVGQSFLYGPFSNLASVTLNDTHHTIYINNITHNNPNLVAKDNHLINDNIAKEKSSKECDLVNVNLKPCKRNKYWPVVHKRVYDAIEKCKDVHLSEDPSIVNLKRHNTQADAGLSGDIHKCDMIVETGNGIISNELDLATVNFDNICKDKNNKQTVNLNTNETLFSNDHTGDFLETNSDGEISTSVKDSNVKIELKTETDILKAKTLKNKSKSRWALKRAEQNKKVKFRIIATNFDDTFTKVQISNEELEECMAKERDSEYYKSKRFKCPKCILGFVDEKDFLKHNEILHTKENLICGGHICDICSITIAHKRHLSAHITQHYCVQKCKLCQFVCRSEDQRLWHFQREHKKIFQCLKCELKFGNRRDFFKHFKEWHEKFICDYCGISFKMRYCIKDHIRKQHSPFTCVPCNKKFARYNGLWLHNKLAHSPAPSPAYCVECDTSYKDIYRYKWHLCNSARHTPKKKIRIPCPECEKTFTKKIYMRDHYNLVHLKLFKYRCEQCDKNFIRNAELVKHRRRTHEGILPPRNKICNLCGRGFTVRPISYNKLDTPRGFACTNSRKHFAGIKCILSQTYFF